MSFIEITGQQAIAAFGVMALVIMFAILFFSPPLRERAKSQRRS